MQERKRLCSSFPIYQISRIRQCTIFSKSGQKILYLCQIFAVFQRLRFPDVYVTIKPRFDTAMYRERAEKDAAGFGFGRRSLRACRRTGGSAGRGAGDGAGAECKTRAKSCWPPAMAAAIWTTPASRPSGISPRTRPGSSLCWLPSTQPTRWAGLSRSASTPAPTRPGGCTPTPTRRQTCLPCWSTIWKNTTSASAAGALSAP